MEKINIELAGIPLELTLRYKMFRDRYADFQTEKKPCACIEITPEQCACAARGYEPGTLPESIEDLELCTKACAALLPHGRAIIHAVCFVWCGKAWLICAPSGVGKTTHYKQWKRLFPNEVEMLNGDKPVLGDFWATWCGPCRMIAPAVEEVAEDFDGRAVVGKVDVDEQAELARRFGIMSIPTLIVMKDGKVVEQAVGARGKADIAAMLERHL